MNKKNVLIYTSGLFQGISLVAFPAASTILTSPNTFHFTNTQYGSLFLPQAMLSIITAFLNSKLCRSFGEKKTLLTGLVANFFSMILLALSPLVETSQPCAYGMLIVATSCLGIGFGAVVPTINRLAEKLNPLKSDSAVLTLNALLGVGTTLAPIFTALFTTMGFWWGLPLFLALAYAVLFLFSYGVELLEAQTNSKKEQAIREKLSRLALIFIAFAFLYGIIETLNGNWASIYMSKHLNASINIQSLVLTSFWGMVTFGRIFFAMMSKYINQQFAFQVAPFISAAAFIVIASLISGQEIYAVIAFGSIGFGCSVLLPLLISFGNTQLKGVANSVPGMIISSYLLGYGVAAFGVGPLGEFAQVSLRAVYLVGAVISFILGFLSIYIVKERKVY